MMRLSAWYFVLKIYSRILYVGQVKEKSCKKEKEKRNVYFKNQGTNIL